MKNLPVLDARCVIFHCKATPEFYKSCNCLFVCHSCIIFLKSVSRISTLYGTKCGVSQYKSIACMLFFCPDGQNHAPSLFCHPGKASGFLQIHKNQKRLLLFFTTEGLEKDFSQTQRMWERCQCLKAHLDEETERKCTLREQKGHKRCQRDPVPIPTEGGESTDLILLP